MLQPQPDLSGIFQGEGKGTLPSMVWIPEPRHGHVKPGPRSGGVR